jgi:hypothetical protein
MGRNLFDRTLQGDGPAYQKSKSSKEVYKKINEYIIVLANYEEVLDQINASGIKNHKPME